MSCNSNLEEHMDRFCRDVV